MKRYLIWAVSIALFASACGADTDDQNPPDTTLGGGTTQVDPPTTSGGNTTPTTGGNGGPTLVNVALRTFPTCDDILDYYIENALELVGPYGLDRGGIVFEDAMAVEEMAAEPASADSSGSTPTFTTTNVQVAGVDEADRVKTDGRYIYSVVGHTNHLRIIEVSEGDAAELATLDVGFSPNAMLLHGDTLLVLASTWRVGPVTHITQVDVSDPQSPEIVAELQVDGAYNGARLSDGVARVVITSSPVGIEWAHPQGSGLRAEQDAIEANRELVRNSDLGNWLPAYVLEQSTSGDPEWGQMVDCSNVLAPALFSGLNTLSIMMFDLNAAGISEWSAAGVVAEGDTIYATADSVYVATGRWVDWRGLSDADVRAESSGYTTLVHRFDTVAGAEPSYEASGEVRGFLLNQFSMDEFEGDLRVAATTSPSWWWNEDSESHVTVLRSVGNRLEEVGSVWGLGEGERIFSVRFMGPDAYLVTFRQIDPLYALDLSDPTDPRVLGELKIPGFSSYLHPVGEDLLMGVGQEASLEGQVEGLQVSLFDVSDPTDPRRVAQVLPLQEDGYDPNYSWSPVENDHRAFVFFEGLALIPYSAYWWGEGSDGYSTDAGVVAMVVEDTDLNLEALLRPLADQPIEEGSPDFRRAERAVPERVIIIDEWIYSVTPVGVAVHQLDTWERVAFADFSIQ